MDELFENIQRASDSHCWFHGFRRFALHVLERVAEGRRDLRLVDCGCGVGQNLPLLARFGRPIGFELEARAAVAAHSFGYPVVRGDITRIPLADNSLDVAASFDVMQCVDSDVAAVREMARVVRPGGRVVLFIAALDVLAGDHAELWNERRRYTPASARYLAETAGLAVEHLTFAFAALFPLMLVMRTTQRLLRPFRRPSDEEMNVPWRPVNAALSRLLDAEAALMRYVPMPFGTSLIVVARKSG